MADITTGQPAPATGPLPVQRPAAARTEQGTGAAKMGTDTLSLEGAARPEEPQYFGHQPRVTLSWLLKQPIWADDRSDIRPEQWAKMPESQRKEILAMVPNEPARAMFLSNMDPQVAASKAVLSDLAKRAGAKLGEIAERERARQAAAAPPEAPKGE